MKNDLSLHVVGAITICTYRCILRVTMQGDRKSNKYKYTREDIRVMIRFEGKKKNKNRLSRNNRNSRWIPQFTNERCNVNYCYVIIVICIIS